MVDITKYLEENRVLKVYGGANGKKVAVDIDGVVYMLKFPSVAKGNNSLSYSNSCICEHLSCSILRLLGFDAQETFLCLVRRHEKEYLCVACKDFALGSWVLWEYAHVKNTCIETSNSGYGTELKEVLDSIYEQDFIPYSEVCRFFWELFVVDALLGNFDRHNGNWGFLVNRDSGLIKLAPIYDCGSCLYPQLSDSGMQSVINSVDEIDKRIFVFPNSALKMNGTKINYYDYLSSTDNELILTCAKRIASTIDFDAINAFIDSEEALSDIQKTFYKTMIKERFNKLILPVAEKQIASNKVKGLNRLDL